MTKQTLSPTEFAAARDAARALLALVGPTAAQLADYSDYMSGAAISQVLADQLDDTHGKRVLTAAEFVTCCAVSYLYGSPANTDNNVWD